MIIKSSYQFDCLDTNREKDSKCQTIYQNDKYQNKHIKHLQSSTQKHNKISQSANNLMKKTQSAGTNQIAVSTKLTMTIPVNESTLPLTTNIMPPNQQITPDFMYNIDARNPHFQMTLTTGNGVGQNIDTKIMFGKNQMRELFEKLDKIQDQINSLT